MMFFVRIKMKMKVRGWWLLEEFVIKTIMALREREREDERKGRGMKKRI